jgi:polyisoprenoid-binding protein YceI
LNLAESKVKVFGTSNLHDWHIDGKMMSGKGNFILADGVLKSIESLTFIVESEQLKSGNSIMDNNTNKALLTNKFKTINYKLTAVTKINLLSENNYSVVTEGDLMIAGTTKKITQLFNLKIKDKKISVQGKTKLNMTTFNVEPPTALMGTIKTGAEVVVDFKVTYN